MAYLKNFPEYELIFDEEETRQILKFFFPNDKELIDKLTIDSKIRNFAQGILVEAVDASYAMGYVEAVFMSIYDFVTSRKLSKGFVTFMKTLARKGMKHWFKHAEQKDLTHAKIYEYVRLGIVWHCRNQFHAIVQQLASRVKGRSGIYFVTSPPNYNKNLSKIAWG